MASPTSSPPSPKWACAPPFLQIRFADPGRALVEPEAKSRTPNNISAATSAAPIARVPQAKSQTARTDRGFRTADLVIALLALAVLAASLVGIFWLSRMK